MKPKYRTFIGKVLPAMIVLPAMAHLAQAGLITPDANGDVVVAGDYDEVNGTAHTVVASGGAATPFLVQIDSGAVLHGDAALFDAVEVTAAGYTIFNNGTLTGVERGIDATGFAIELANTGIIQGLGTEGVFALGGSTINNAGSITGVTGVWLTTGGSTFVNSGVITGTGGVALQMGIDGNNVQLNSNGRFVGDVLAAGTGNTITATAGRVEGNISGFDNIQVANNGYLQIYGDIATPSTITVGQNADLGGNGNWKGNLSFASGSYVYASQAPGVFDAGVLDIDGNALHSAGSTILVGIDPNLAIANDGTNSSLIRSISGTYDATAATIRLENYDDAALRNGTYVIVEDAGGTVLGGNNPLTYQGYSDAVLARYFSRAVLSGGDLVTIVDHDFSSLPGFTENQSALGEVFDMFMDDESTLASGLSRNPALRDFIGLLDVNNLAYNQAVFASILHPAESVLGSTGSVVNSNYRLHRMAQDHLAMARNSGERTVTTTSAPTTDAKGAMVPGTTQTETVGGGRGNLWGTYSHDWQDFQNDGSGDYDGEVSAATAGFDYRVGSNLILGILVDGSKSDIDHPGGGSDVESIRGAIYGTWGASTGLYADFLAGYGDHDLDFTDASSLQGLLTFGYAMGDERFRHGPFIGAEYQKVEVDGFDAETVFPMSVDDFDVESFRGLAGYRLNADLGRFRPYFSVAYAHEFSDDRYYTDASIGGLPFRVNGVEPGSAILVTAGAGIGLTDALTLNVGYRGEILLDDEGTESHGGSVGLNYRF